MQYSGCFAPWGENHCSRGNHFCFVANLDSVNCIVERAILSRVDFVVALRSKDYPIYP